MLLQYGPNRVLIDTQQIVGLDWERRPGFVRMLVVTMRDGCEHHIGLPLATEVEQEILAARRALS